MYVSAIVVAAGKGRRLKTKVPKPLVKINSQPIIVYAVKNLSRHPEIKDIIIVANLGNLKGIRAAFKRYNIAKLKKIVLGGRLRQNSVLNGLKAMDKKTELVLIHDGVRPFINKNIVSSTIAAAKKSGAAVAGMPVKATIKKIKNQKSKVKIVEKTIDRDNLWEIQTPQVFKKGLILKAYQEAGSTQVTDDAALIEKLGKKVKVVTGSRLNIKITTPEDLLLARAICRLG